MACVTAEALFRCDPLYFYRRLPIIALEEVSLGNLGACFEVLIFCRNLPLRRKFAGRGLAGYLGARLAATLKSRSACDLLSLVNARGGQQAVENEIAGLTARTAMDAACSPAAAPLRLRCMALLRLERLPIRNGDSRAESMRRVSASLRLPAVIADVLVNGNGTHGLNAMLPLVYELMAKHPLRIGQTELAQSVERLDGPILCSSADQYTRLGRAAIRTWLHAVPDLLDFFAKRRLTGREERIVGMALFHVEGSILSRRLSSNCLDILRTKPSARRWRRSA